MAVAGVLAVAMYAGIQVRAGSADVSSAEPAAAALNFEPAMAGRADETAVAVRQTFSDSSKAATVVVIGDSTGDEPSEWVYRVGTWASEQFNRPVVLHPWDLGTSQYGPPVTLGSGAGQPLTIWNGSAAGEKMQYSRNMLDKLLPPAPVDAVFISHAHNQGVTEVVGPLNELTYAIEGHQPDAKLVFIGQNPNRQPNDPTRQDEKVAQVLDFVGTAYPAIDVLAAFNATPDPNALLKDMQHPNDAGSQLWADTVIGWLSAT